MASASSVSAQAAPPFGPSTNINLKNIFYFSPWGSQLDKDTNADGTTKGHVTASDYFNEIIDNNIYDILIGNNTPP